MATDKKASVQRAPDGTNIAGRRPEPPPSSAPVLRMDPRANFVLLHHPHRLDVVFIDDEPVVVPMLRRFHFEPGVSGVEQIRGRSDGNPSRAIATLVDKGWTQLDPGMTVTAWEKSEEGYVRVYDGHRGPVHLDVWTRPYVLGAQVLMDFDSDGWNEFRRDLFAKKVLSPPDKIVLRALATHIRRAMIKRRTTETAQAIASSEIYERKLAAFAIVEGGKKTAATPKKED